MMKDSDQRQAAVRCDLYNVRNNWHELSNELNALAGLPKALRIIED